MRSTYIVGFNRDRDQYEVPLALAERDALTCAVTDYYAPDRFPSIPTLGHRRRPELSSRLFRSSRMALARQASHKAVSASARWPISFPFDQLSRDIARLVSSTAKRNPESDLLVYSTYAFDAFLKFPERRKVLFQFHPGRSAVTEALRGDPFDNLGWIQEPEEFSDFRDECYEIETRTADLVLCASTYVKRGLVDSGVHPDSVVVVPYGCPPVMPIVETERRNVVFLGQAVRRKGIAALIRAWEECNHAGRQLRVVSSHLDPVARRLISQSRDVCLVEGASRAEVKDELASADALVLPSRLEGFGLVYGEALAAGCRLIGTSSTGLPDLNLPPEVASVLLPDDQQGLVSALDALVAEQDVDRRAIQALAQDRSWATFRASVRKALGIEAD